MNESKRRSRSARLVKMSGAAISAKTNKTTTVHMSSTSVETEAACQAALDIVAMRHMLEEIGIWYNEPVVIYEDNQPTIRVANNETSIADAGRHIEVGFASLLCAGLLVRGFASRPRYHGSPGRPR